MEKAIMNILREGDFVFLGEEKLLVKDCQKGNGIYSITVERNGKDINLMYNIVGDSMENPSLNITNVELVERPEDKITVYYPDLGVDVLPVLTINGEDMFIYKLTDLDGLEVKEPQTLKAAFKYVVVANLLKKKGRDLQLLKSEKIICESKEDCQAKLDEISKHFIGVDKENESVVKDIFEKTVDNKKNSVYLS